MSHTGQGRIPGQIYTWDGQTQVWDFPPFLVPEPLWLWDAALGRTMIGPNVSDWASQAFPQVASQAVPASRPLFVPSSPAFKNQPVIDLDGIDDYLFNAAGAGALNGLDGYTIIYVARTDVPASNQIPFTTSDAATNTGNLIVQIFAGEHYTHIGLGSSGRFAIDANPHVISSVYDGSRTGDIERLKSWLDGTQQGLTFGAPIPPVAPAIDTQLRIGSYLTLGAAVYDGPIAWLAVYDYPLTMPERKLVEAILKDRYGTP